MPSDSSAAERGPWNPGIESALPRAFMPLATVFRPENVKTRLEDAVELSGFSGMLLQDLVAFRAERLVVHELLIRVMADLSVPDGQKYEDLGVNFRSIAAKILSDYIVPDMDRIVASLDELDRRVSTLLQDELPSLLAAPSAGSADEGGGRTWLGVFGRARAKPQRRPVSESGEERGLRILTDLQRRATSADDPLAGATYRALRRIISAIIGHRGHLIGDPALLSSLARTLVCNEHGSQLIGQLIEPCFDRAVAREGYHRLAAQDRPIVMNVKGASASGKSTMRPFQRALAGRIGAQWSDFALISPDIWRKFLLDYDSLDAARGYAGTLTGHEVEIIDKKLDRYMARKANEGRMSHLLIDRFRFDSFAANSDTEDGSQLLTRFGSLVYMLFMITPPDATVERAWKRGQQFGRYKAVDDLLAHNVEAYTGMPRLFFTWALKSDKRVHYEFLDNSVPEGSRPRTIAFGSNNVMNILDLKFILDVDRFRKINITAGNPAEVYPDENAMGPENNTDFLKQCSRMMTTINFVDPGSERVYARLDRKRLVCLDREFFSRKLEDADIRASFAAIAGDNFEATAAYEGSSEVLSRGQTQTLGAWSEAVPRAD